MNNLKNRRFENMAEKQKRIGCFVDKVEIEKQVFFSSHDLCRFRQDIGIKDLLS